MASKGRSTSVSTKPKRVRKSELEKQLMAMELEAEERDKASPSLTHTTVPPPPNVVSDIDITEAAIRVQWEHPEYGLKRVLKHLRTSQRMTISEARLKKLIWKVPTFEHGAMCVVGEVFPTSPAAYCGLFIGDVIVEFDDQTAKVYTSIGETLVPIISDTAKCGRTINATVLRRPRTTAAQNVSSGVLNLTLSPKVWSGGGVLECVLHEAPFPVR